MSQNLWPLAGLLLLVGLSAGGLSRDSPQIPAPLVDKPIPVFGPDALTTVGESRASMEYDVYRVPERVAIGLGSVHRRDHIRPLTRVALVKDLLPLLQMTQRWDAAAILILIALTPVVGMWAADGSTFASRKTSPDIPSSRVPDGFENNRDNVEKRLPKAFWEPGIWGGWQTQAFSTRFGTTALHPAVKPD